MKHSASDLELPGNLTFHPSADFDALADLFLTEPGAAPVRSHAAPSPTPAAAESNGHAPVKPRVEGLVLGHLPVLAAAWVTQYAKHLADTEQTTVGVVRLAGGETWIDVVLPRGTAARTSSRIGNGVANADLGRAFAAAGAVGVWLLRVDAPGELDWPATAGLSAVTLLTGADEAAIVASYHTIKALFPRGGGDDLPLHIAVMGADAEQAANAESKLRKSAQAFLDRGIASFARVGKIGACSTQTLFHSAAAATPAEIIARISDSPSRMGARGGGWVENSPGSMTVPNPTRSVGVPTIPNPGRPDMLPGLKAVKGRCPYTPGVEVASGPQGSMHLLARTGELSVAEAVRQLLTAASWADAHAALLDAANPGVFGDAESRGPTLHLLTDDPKAATGLLHTGVRVHLSVGVEIEGKRHEVVRDMN